MADQNAAARVNPGMTMFTGLFVGVVLGTVIFSASFRLFDKYFRPTYLPNVPSLLEDREIFSGPFRGVS
jgi:hypothetical protein